MTNNRTYLPPANPEKILPILGKISVLHGFSEDQLRTVLARLRSVSYGRGEFIFRQGESPTHIYVIERGRVKIIVDVDRTPMELVAYGVGRCFGETSAIGILPHSASAIATEDTDLIVLSREALHGLYESDPKVFGLLILNIAREACRRLHRTDEILLHYAAARER